MKKLGIILVFSLLTACRCGPPLCFEHKLMNEDRYARCEELKHEIMFNTVATDQLGAAQLNAQLDELYRQYKLEGC